VDKDRVRQIVRQFPENGLKIVLNRSDNLRDLLTLARAAMLPRLDFRAMQVDPTTYVTAEYRHVCSDLVLTLPLLSSKGKRRKRLTVSILIELQMQPDRLMLLRVLEYLVQVWKQQVKQHGEEHGSLASVKLRPVLPVVLHTGSYSWEGLGSLLDLMDDAECFRAVTPAFEPLFVSLPNLTEEELDNNGGYLGQVLALLRARKTSRSAFEQRLYQTVAKLEELPGAEQLRRQELLSYVEALVYHAREASEHSMLRERIDAALLHNADRLEVSMVRQTMAEIHRDEGRLEGRLEGTLAERKRFLVESLRLRFKSSVSPQVEQVIEATQDGDQLAEWLRRFHTAETLDAIGFLSPN
jgi:Putative transposase, YhgA-like